MYYQKHLFICTNQRDGKACCGNHHAAAMCTHAKLCSKQSGKAGPGGIRVSSAGCLGRCDEGPVAVVYPDNVWYRYNGSDDIERIVKQHLVDGEVVEELML